ncbi:hypothetical protein AB1Y20_006639 [Prymnesium parvum]|uniref:AMP-dependent synthetase/ligase domain-containing protein n=1 Tax=Prymnesium parvum TaxID=97485 RepID=A0AB34IYY2_PRYPA
MRHSALLHHLPLRAARLFGDRPFLEQWLASGETLAPISFAEFARRVESARQQLRTLGVGRGHRLALLTHACADALALSLAAPALGAVVVQLNWRQPPAVLLRLLRRLGCAALVASRGLAEPARRLAAARCGVRLLLLLEGAEAEGGVVCVREVAFSTDPSRASPPSGEAAAAEHEVSPDDVAVVMFTSGTSSLPKAVPLTHRALLHSSAAKEAAEARVLRLLSPNLAASRADGAQWSHRGTLAFLPTFHVIGFTNNFVYNLHAGVRCMLYADAPTIPLSGELLLRACAALQPSIVDTVPALLEAMLPLSHERAAPLRACAAVLYGGSSLRPAVAAALRAVGVRLCSQYGQTELAGMALLGPPEAAHGCMRPVGSLRCRLVPRDGEEGSAVVERGVGRAPCDDAVVETGELVLSGVEALSPCYWRLEEGSGEGEAECGPPGGAARAAGPEQEWATSDVFERTADGWYRHVCRLDELLLHSSGEMTNARAVESALAQSLEGLIDGCCLLGSGRPCPALILELGANAAALPTEMWDRSAAGLPAAISMDGAAAGDELSRLASRILQAVDLLNAELPSHSRVPEGLVLMLHPRHHERLARTAKGGVARAAAERRFAPWLEEVFARAPVSVSLQPDAPGDSLGLTALAGGGRRAMRANAAKDALLQHLKVALLFAVLLRHLQRFTVKTCHAWGKVLPVHSLVCVANNLLQTGAAEGLAFLSGAALAGRRLHCREVSAPFLLILLFRQLLHPILEVVFSYRVDIGTAHLWFVLMVGFGRLLCWPLSLLASADSTAGAPAGHLAAAPAFTDSSRACRLASRARVSAALLLFAWRLLLAPQHIGLLGAPFLRKLLYYTLFGDRNYLQIVHNLPLFLIGFVSNDLYAVMARDVLPGVCSKLYVSSSNASKRVHPSTFSNVVRRATAVLESRVGPALSTCYARRTTAFGLAFLSFVLDPLVFGIFTRKAKAREILPIVVYTRAALRVGALAAILPRRPTPLTNSGRSQLLAYLLHDAVFAIFAQVVIPTLLPLPRLAIMFSSVSSAMGSSSFFTSIVAVTELVAYCSACLAVQLLLSQPLLLAPLIFLTRLRDGLTAIKRRIRLSTLLFIRRATGFSAEKKRPGELTAL